jgi:hypothetical protein
MRKKLYDFPVCQLLDSPLPPPGQAMARGSGAAHDPSRVGNAAPKFLREREAEIEGSDREGDSGALCPYCDAWNRLEEPGRYLCEDCGRFFVAVAHEPIEEEQ